MRAVHDQCQLADVQRPRPMRAVHDQCLLLLFDVTFSKRIGHFNACKNWQMMLAVGQPRCRLVDVHTPRLMRVGLG